MSRSTASRVIVSLASCGADAGRGQVALVFVGVLAGPRDHSLPPAGQQLVGVVGRIAEVNQRAVDPQQQLVVDVGESQLVRSRRFDAGLAAGFEVERLAGAAIDDAERDLAVGQIDRRAEVKARLDQIERQFAAGLGDFDRRVDSQIADPFGAEAAGVLSGVRMNLPAIAFGEAAEQAGVVGVEVDDQLRVDALLELGIPFVD